MSGLRLVSEKLLVIWLGRIMESNMIFKTAHRLLLCRGIAEVDRYTSNAITISFLFVLLIKVLLVKENCSKIIQKRFHFSLYVSLSHQVVIMIFVPHYSFFRKKNFVLHKNLANWVSQ